MKIATFVFWLLMTSAFAQERVGNGEGLAEQRMTTINEYLPYYISICLNGGCMMSPNEMDKIKSLLELRKFEPNFLFLSGKKYPGFFAASGPFANMRTTRDPKSEVKINSDKLYLAQQAISQEEALAKVIAVYDYKAGTTSDELLIKKLAIALAQNISTAQHSFDYSYLTFALYRSNNLYGNALFVNDGELSLNVGQSLLEHFNCPDLKKISLLKTSWLDSDKQFALIVEGDWSCSKSIHFRILVELNLKNLGSAYPGAAPRMKLEEKGVIRSIENL